MNGSRGFTLVEMLVSMILLSMVILIGSTAYSQFSQRWDGRLGHFNQTASHARKLILIQETLQSITPYVVTDEKNAARVYFEGNRNGFVAVSLRSLFEPEMPAVIRLQLTQQADFSFALTYQEALMSDQLLTRAQQVINFGDEIILFSGLKEAEFSYFGWPSGADKYRQPDSDIISKPAKWSDKYNSLESALQPEQISIFLSNEQLQYNIQVRLNDMRSGLLWSYGDNKDV